jgi:hypothetical protein
MAHLHAARAALWSEHHPVVALGLLYGTLAYLGVAVLIGVPWQAIITLILVGPAALWGFSRYGPLSGPQASKLKFFTWEDNGPVRLSEDVLSSKIVYCIGVRNEGTKIAGRVHVNIDGIEGYPRPTSGAPLPIFQSPDSNADLKPGDSEYFCVMRKIERSAEDDVRVTICCHSDLETPNLSIQELMAGRTMTLSAHSEGAPSITRQIQISSKHEPGANWALHFRLLPNADEVPTGAAEQRSVARAPQVKKASARIRARVKLLGEFFARVSSKKGLARRRTGLHQLTIRHAVTGGKWVAADAVQAVKDTLLDKGTQFDAKTKEESSAQCERIRRLLARQARA